MSETSRGIGFQVDVDRNRVTFDNGEILRLRRTETLLLAILAKHFGQVVSMDRMIIAVYGDDPMGGPDDPAATIRVYISALRGKLKSRGFAIPNYQDSGWELVRTPRLEDGAAAPNRSGR